MKKRIYKYDNVKAFLILLVVIGHMVTDYAPDSFIVRRLTLWIYLFHMPAFIFISGLMHKQYITDERAALGIRGETRLRCDKVLGFFFCAYGLKIFLQFTRTLMGQNPLWHWIDEPGIPWYLFVMAEYELFFYLIRKIDGKVKPVWMIIAAFVLSALSGYVTVIDDTFCIARFINFLPIYMIGYYLDMNRFLEFAEKKQVKIAGWIIILASIIACHFAGWHMYYWRKWMTGRRSYDFLTDYFSYAVKYGWWIRIAVWLVAMLISLAIIAVIPNIDLGYITIVGSRTLQVYFWHRPLCYLFRTLKVLPNLYVLFGGIYDEAIAGVTPGHAFSGGGTGPMIAALIVYVMIGIAMTAFFGLKIFEHPTSDLMKLGKIISNKLNAKERF